MIRNLSSKITSNSRISVMMISQMPLSYAIFGLLSTATPAAAWTSSSLTARTRYSAPRDVVWKEASKKTALYAPKRWLTTTTSLSSSMSPSEGIRFRRGNPIQVEVTRFGPLGATVEVIATSHKENDLIPVDEPPLAYGLILQAEIGYYRAARGGLDVVVGEILPAYVNWVRDDGKVDITIRKPGGKGKAEDLSKTILDKIKAEGGKLQIGDKSSPHDINSVIPGASKAQFKRAVALLYKQGKVQPGPHETKLL